MNRAPNAEDARRATRLTVAFMLLILMATTTLADNPKPHQLAPVPIQQVVIQDEFWIENRGNHEGRKSYGPYGQDHQPVLQQETIEGHAVRATLLGAGLVATANVNGREAYLTAARRLWENMVQRRMYVIGGLGAVAGHEGFGPDYVLPNNGYLETCAAIGAEVKLTVEPDHEIEFALNLRLPAWCSEPKVRVNGKSLAGFEKVRGYACLRRQWQPGDVAELSLPMQRLKAHPKIEADIGRVALQRGPLIYCLEAADNGGQVRNLVISPEAQLSAQHRADLLGGVTVITGQALAWHRAAWPESLYLPSTSVPGVTPIEFTAIPYFANANRQPGEMRVWMAETTPQADPLP